MSFVVICCYLTGMDPPPTSFPPPVPPTTVAPPTPPTPSPCRDVRKNYIEENYPLPPRCLDQVSFRPIQCWPIGGSSSVYCTCTDPITGASYGGSSWIHTCPSPILTQYVTEANYSTFWANSLFPGHLHYNVGFKLIKRNISLYWITSLDFLQI